MGRIVEPSSQIEDRLNMNKRKDAVLWSGKGQRPQKGRKKGFEEKVL